LGHSILEARKFFSVHVDFDHFLPLSLMLL